MKCHETFSGISKEMKFVYFAQMRGGGPVKIGSAKDLPSRLKGLRREFGEHLNFAVAVPGRMVDEITLHHVFSEDRIVGEWFAPSLKLTAFMEMLAKIGELPDQYRWHEPPRRVTKSRGPRKITGTRRPKMSATMVARSARLAPAKEAARARLLQELQAAQ